MYSKWVLVKEHMKLRQKYLNKKFSILTKLNGYFQMMVFISSSDIAGANSFLKEASQVFHSEVTK